MRWHLASFSVLTVIPVVRGSHQKWGSCPRKIPCQMSKNVLFCWWKGSVFTLGQIKSNSLSQTEIWNLSVGEGDKIGKSCFGCKTSASSGLWPRREMRIRNERTLCLKGRICEKFYILLGHEGTLSCLLVQGLLCHRNATICSKNWSIGTFSYYCNSQVWTKSKPKCDKLVFSEKRLQKLVNIFLQIGLERCSIRWPGSLLPRKASAGNYPDAKLSGGSPRCSWHANYGTSASHLCLKMTLFLFYIWRILGVGVAITETFVVFSWKRRISPGW